MSREKSTDWHVRVVSSGWHVNTHTTRLTLPIEKVLSLRNVLGKWPKTRQTATVFDFGGVLVDFYTESWETLRAVARTVDRSATLPGERMRRARKWRVGLLLQSRHPFVAMGPRAENATCSSGNRLLRDVGLCGH